MEGKIGKFVGAINPLGALFENEMQYPGEFDLETSGFVEMNDGEVWTTVIKEGITIRENVIEPQYVPHAQLYSFLHGTEDEATEAIKTLGLLETDPKTQVVFEAPHKEPARLLGENVLWRSSNSQQAAP